MGDQFQSPEEVGEKVRDGATSLRLAKTGSERGQIAASLHLTTIEGRVPSIADCLTRPASKLVLALLEVAFGERGAALDDGS